MKDYIFKYLDKRYPIEGNVVHFKDEYPFDRIADLFGVGTASDFIIYEWAQSRIGEEYCLKYPNGDEEWLKGDLWHREGGPALTYASGEQHWYLNDDLHREDGPAVIYPNGAKYWYRHGERHRDDGPAMILPGGDKKWYENGVFIKQS